jgi:hypothetical protein
MRAQGQYCVDVQAVSELELDSGQKRMVDSLGMIRVCSQRMCR